MEYFFISSSARKSKDYFAYLSLYIANKKFASWQRKFFS